LFIILFFQPRVQPPGYIINGKALSSTRRNIAQAVKVPLYSVDRILYLLFALKLISIETAGRTNIVFPTVFADEILSIEPK